MNRTELETYICETYGAAAEFPWLKHPRYMVFRHGGNHKWFAVVMDLPSEKLGLPSGEPVDVLNVKCDPLLLGSLLREAGFYPAYHMSKASWVTVALDGSVSDEKIKWLLAMSFDLTAPKVRKKPV